MVFCVVVFLGFFFLKTHLHAKPNSNYQFSAAVAPPITYWIMSSLLPLPSPSNSVSSKILIGKTINKEVRAIKHVHSQMNGYYKHLQFQYPGMLNIQCSGSSRLYRCKTISAYLKCQVQYNKVLFKKYELLHHKAIHRNISVKNRIPDRKGKGDQCQSNKC